MARLIAETDTRTPVFSSHVSQWLWRVASSFSSSWLHNIRFSSAVERMRRFLPVENLGERSSPALLLLSHRLSVVGEMEKVSTTSFLGMPRSTAPTALALRSFE
jgi:hypothetical protein